MSKPNSAAAQMMFLNFKNTEYPGSREEAFAAAKIHEFYCAHYEAQIEVLNRRLREYIDIQTITGKLNTIEGIVRLLELRSSAEPKKQKLSSALMGSL